MLSQSRKPGPVDLTFLLHVTFVFHPKASATALDNCFVQSVTLKRVTVAASVWHHRQDQRAELGTLSSQVL